MAVDYVEDPIQRIVSLIVNVSGIPTFVVKSGDTEILYGIVAGSPEQSQIWTQWEEAKDYWGGFYSNSGGSSAIIKQNDADPGKAVWVVSSGVSKDRDGGGYWDGTAILYSEDGGITWEEVYALYEEVFDDGDTRINWFYEPTGIVWDEDEKAFFASVFVSDFIVIRDGEGIITDIIAPEGEEILRSSNGRSWTSVSRNMILEGNSQDDATTPSELNQYCKKPENRNYLGGPQKIPDGLQGYNKNTKVFIKPDALQGFDPWNGARYLSVLGDGTNNFLATPLVTVVDDTTGRAITKAVDMPGCYVVAYFNNAWLAAGGNIIGGSTSDRFNMHINVSFDEGQVWTSVFHSSGIWMAATANGQSLVPSNEGPSVPPG